MKGRTAGFLMFACVGLAAAGCYAGTVLVQPKQVQEENSTKREQFAESSELKAPSADTEEAVRPNPEKEAEYLSGQAEASEKLPEDIEGMQETQEEDAGTEVQESSEEQEQSKRLEPDPSEKEQREMLTAGDQTEDTEKDGTRPRPSDVRIQKTYSPSDVPPGDTVGFTPSRKEEIMEDRYVESVVDENDPDSYEIIKKEETVPTLYVNSAGDIKYAYEDGVWYEYRYSHVNITLDTEDEELALLILNIDGSYDGYDVISTDSREVAKEDGSIEYEFHVRYQGVFAMEAAPSELGHLTAADLGSVAATRTVITEEKVPVMMQESVGTGEYQYYGWQVLDDGTYYFDPDGNKVTGSQVIQGIRHGFDENGVRTSRAGVEVTEENGEIDWEKAAGAGLDFAVIQCAYRDAGEGRIITDSRAEEYIRGAQAAGLDVMLSVFSQAVTPEEAVEEAVTAISMAEKYGLEGPVAVTGAYANPEHNGRADELEPSERTACMEAFCQTAEEKGYTPILHAELDWMTDGLVMEELMDNPLWVAEYSTNLTYTGTCRFWQYTARGTVEGISGYTGLIISYENRRDFQ